MTSGSAVAIATIFFTSLSLVFVSMRLVARIVFLKNSGRDEIAIVVSSLSSIALTVSTLYQVKYGLGEHIDTLTTADFEEVLKCLWVAIIFYHTCLWLTKVSIIFQYIRVFVGPRIRKACWAVLFIVTAHWISAFITAIWACVPIESFWNLEQPGKCINKKFQWFFNAAFNIFTDLLIITLPMPVLSSLNLPAKQKIGLMIIFALGGFVCLVSILRLHSLYIVSVSTDITRDNANASLWSNIEVSIGIICASLPTIKPLISYLFPKLLTSTRSRQGTTYRSHRSNAAFSTIRNNPNDELNDLESGRHGKMVTRVEAGERSEQDLVGDIKGDGIGSKGDIFVLTSMTQDVERKTDREGPVSEADSEKDLIFQRN